MNNLPQQILQKLVVQPGITYAELCAENHPKVAEDELSEILHSCGIKFTDSRETLLFERWDWEFVVFQQIYQLADQSANKWFEETIALLQKHGLAEHGSRLWLKAYLAQLDLNVDDRNSINFKRDLKMFEDISRDKVSVPSGESTIRKFARFITRAGLYLIVGQASEVVRSWIILPLRLKAQGISRNMPLPGSHTLLDPPILP